VSWQEQVAQNAQNAQRYQALHERLSRVSITETSRDGMVKVTVSADGVLTGLVMKERWHPPPLPELAAQIMDCLHRAEARIPEVVQQAVTETVGAPDASTHLLLSDARKKFPEPAPLEPRQQVDEPRSAPRPQQAPVERRPEDDWDGRPVLEDI
jgi:DNA-binding protein YbaB